MDNYELVFTDSNESSSEKVVFDDFEIKNEINQVAELSVNVANTVDNRQIVKQYDRVKFYRNGVLEFTGRTDYSRIKYSMEHIGVEAKALYVVLAKQFFSKDQNQYDVYRVEYNNINANDILNDVLSGTNFSVVECPDAIISLRGEHETRLQWIAAVAKACKYEVNSETRSCDWYIDVNNQIHIVEEKGDNRGEIQLADIENEKDYSQITNVVHGLGYGDGINQVFAVAENQNSIDKYGRRGSLVSDRRYKYKDSLQAQIQSIADTNGQPVSKVRANISAYDFFENELSTGDTITLTVEWADIEDEQFRIKKYKVGIEEAQLELANVLDDLTTELQEMKKSLKDSISYMVGMTVPLNFSNMDNVEPNYPLRLHIHIPQKTQAINAFYISFELEPFRAFVDTTEEESQHTHGFSISNHTHSVNIPSHTHTVNIPSHTHSVSIPSHYHEVNIPSHTHNLVIHDHTHTISKSDHTHSVTIPSHDHEVNIPSHYHGISLPDHRHDFDVWGHYDGTTTTLIGLSQRSGNTVLVSGGSDIVQSEAGGGQYETTNSGGNTTVTSTQYNQYIQTSSAGGGFNVTSSEGGYEYTSTYSGGSSVQSTSSGGQTTESTSSGGSSSVTSESGGSSNITSASGGATSSTTAEGSAHKHGTQFGIMEDIQPSVNVSLRIDGQNVAVFSGGQTEFDVTQYIQTNGHHTIELAASGRIRIQAEAWGQVFIQSD